MSADSPSLAVGDRVRITSAVAGFHPDFVGHEGTIIEDDTDFVEVVTDDFRLIRIDPMRGELECVTSLSPLDHARSLAARLEEENHRLEVRLESWGVALRAARAELRRLASDPRVHDLRSAITEAALAVVEEALSSEVTPGGDA